MTGVAIGECYLIQAGIYRFVEVFRLAHGMELYAKIGGNRYVKMRANGGTSSSRMRWVDLVTGSFTDTDKYGWLVYVPSQSEIDANDVPFDAR